MLMETYEELNACIVTTPKFWCYIDLENPEKTYRIPKNWVGWLKEYSDIEEVLAICIWGKCKEIYALASSIREGIFMPTQRLRHTLKELLKYRSGLEIYRKFSDLKFYEIDEPCRSDNPLQFFINL